MLFNFNKQLLRKCYIFASVYLLRSRYIYLFTRFVCSAMQFFGFPSI